MLEKHFLTQEESKRLQIMKVFLTMMVIFIHSYSEEIVNSNIGTQQFPNWLYWTEYIISKIFCNWAVPTFFVISAILLYSKEFVWKENMKKKTKSLLLPYMIFNLFWIFFYFVAQSVSITRPYFSNTSNIISTWGINNYFEAFLGSKGTPFLYPLWFVRDLYVLNIASKGLKKIIDICPKIIILLLAIITIFGLDIPFFFLSRTALIYFSLGYYLVKYKVKLSSLRFNTYILTVIYMVTIVFDCITVQLVVHPIAGFVSVITGMIWGWNITDKIMNSPQISGKLLKISRYCFLIYLLHEMNLSILRKLMVKILPVELYSYLVIYFILPIVIFTLCVICCIFMEKKLPKIYRILNGGRVNPMK